MYAIRSACLAVLLTVLSLAACDNQDAEADVAARVELAAAPAHDAAVPENSSDRLELNISDGPFAGTHQVTGDMDCFAQPGVWGAGLTRMGDPAISQFLLMLQGVPPTGGSSQDVNFTVVFGDPMDETSTDSGMIGLSAVAGGGTGTGTAKRDGRGAVIEVEGTTHTGAKISAVIRCENIEIIQ